MGHEPWPNGLFPIDRASASQRVSKVRSSLSWRSLLEELLLLGSGSRHGFRTIDLQGESRDIEACLRSMQSNLYQMGFRGKVSRSTLADWQSDIGGVAGQQRVDAALKPIELQDAKLAELQEKTAKLGVNITLEVRQLVRSDEIYAA